VPKDAIADYFVELSGERPMFKEQPLRIAFAVFKREVSR